MILTDLAGIIKIVDDVFIFATNKEEFESQMISKYSKDVKNPE